MVLEHNLSQGRWEFQCDFSFFSFDTIFNVTIGPSFRQREQCVCSNGTGFEFEALQGNQHRIHNNRRQRMIGPIFCGNQREDSDR